ncbi:MAG: TetR/AcrR family transcriptional regulator [Candidatus Limnocylindrales bacterium]
MNKRTKADPSEQSRSRRERILDAAFTTFAGRGYRDASMDDIAAAAETSKGGVYFHFPTKESIFRELMRTTADKLVGKVERAVAAETDPIARAEIAIQTVLATFAGHRTMARLLFLDVIGAGRVFQAEANELHERFARLIQGYLDQAVADGVIPPTDTRVTSIAWFGALNEVAGRWLQAEHPGRLEEAYPALRATLLRSVGVAEERIMTLPSPVDPGDFPEGGR